MSARAGPLNNFIGCRINPTLQTLVAIAEGKLPEPTLGEASLIPQDEGAQELGGVRVVTDPDTNTGEAEVTIPVAAQPSYSLVGSGPANSTNSNTSISGGPSPRYFRVADREYSRYYAKRGARHSGRLLQESGDLSSLEASCYTHLTNAAGQRVGQVLGDCIVFTPSAPLSGPAQLCLPIDAAIPVNPQFTQYVFALRDADGIIRAMPNTVSVSTNGQEMCAGVQESSTYCPGKTYAQTTGASVVSANHSCGTFAAVSSSVLSQATEFVASGAYAGVSLAGLAAISNDQVDNPDIDLAQVLLAANGGTSNVTQRVAVTISGSFTMTVAGAANFASDPMVRQALRASVADSIGSTISASDVEITSMLVDGNAIETSSGRRLQDSTGEVVVNYRVTVPEDVDAASVSSAISSIEPSALTSTIAAQLATFGLDTYADSVSVQSMSAPTQGLLVVDVSPTTTAPPSPASGTANSAWAACRLAPMTAAIVGSAFLVACLQS